MDETGKALIEKLPVKFIVSALSLCLAWFGVLTVVALTTQRSVDFFPPRIGSDPVIQVQIQELSKRALEITQTEQAHRAQLLAALNRSKEKSLSLQERMASGTSEASYYVRKSEDALAEEDEKFIVEIKALRADVQKLAAKF